MSWGSYYVCISVDAVVITSELGPSSTGFSKAFDGVSQSVIWEEIPRKRYPGLVLHVLVFGGGDCLTLQWMGSASV